MSISSPWAYPWDRKKNETVTQILMQTAPTSLPFNITIETIKIPNRFLSCRRCNLKEIIRSTKTSTVFPGRSSILTPMRKAAEEAQRRANNIRKSAETLAAFEAKLRDSRRKQMEPVVGKDGNPEGRTSEYCSPESTWGF